MTEQILPIKTIRIDGGTQIRFAFNPAVAADYADAIREGHTLPPVIVFHDGKNYWAADGFHRIEGYKQAGIGEVVCDVREGTKRDAFLYALGANAEHGLRRTTADKQNAVRMAMTDPELRNLSVNEIAKVCRVNHATASKVVKELEAAGEVKRETVKGADGKQHPAHREVRAREPEREPGDETEHEPPANPVAAFFDSKPKPKSTHFDDSQFDRLFGPLVRFIQARSERLNCVNCVHQRKIESAFDSIEAEFRAWQKAMPA